MLTLSIILLTLSGEGSAFLERLRNFSGDKKVENALEITSSRTERILMEGTPWETELIIVISPHEGPTIMVVGGIHGDEPAGYMAAGSIASWAIDRGTLLVLPNANVPAISNRSRMAPGDSDLNRAFPGNPGGSGAEQLAAEIYSVMIEYEPSWVIDLHEAENFERELKGALGQTFIYPENSVSEDIVKELLTSVNRTMIIDEYSFILLRGMAPGSAIEAASQLGADALIIETCIRMSLHERVKIHRQVVSSLLYLLDITVY
jgi:predicted deacylase